MTPDKLKESIAVMQAAIDGKTIQSKEISQDDWEDTTPGFDFYRYDYRVKPEPLECWIVLSPKGQIKAHPTLNSAETWFNFSDKIIHMREVEND